MKRNLVMLLGASLIFASCANETSEELTVEEEVVELTYSNFGAEITTDGAIGTEIMLATFQNLEEGDTIPIKFHSTITQVCQKKGCWMDMDLGQDEVAFVRFTDYGFFVPFNAGAHDAIVEGRAFLSVVSVDELKHYAKDAGKSQEEIDEITEPKITYAIQADGVLIEDSAVRDVEVEEEPEVEEA